MKAPLLFPDRDFDPDGELPANEPALTQDLRLGGGDGFLTEVARRVVLSSLASPDLIIYRQHVLHDCLEQPDVVRRIYDLALEAVNGEKQIWRAMFSQSPAMLLHRAVTVRTTRTTLH